MLDCSPIELDDALGLTALAGEMLADARTGKNGRHALIGMLRQSVFGRLAGYEDVNDAERLRHDPAMRWIGTATATGSHIDVKRSIALRSIKTREEVRLDDDETRILGSRRADVTALGARESPAEELALPKPVESGESQLRKTGIRWMSD